MADVRVLVYTQGGVQFDVGYIDAIPVSLNYVIAEIRQPEKRQSSSTKTINLPGSKEVNEFFELIFETNTSLNYFDPNFKCPFYYYVDSVEQMRGDLQLLKITIDDDTEDVNYEIQVTGRLGTLFSAFGDALLTDLDFSEYDHDLTKVNVTDSWATQIQVNAAPQAFAYGVGYTYPLIDYGYNSGHLSEFHVKHLRPALFKKTIWDKCFEYANKTYSSAHINSSYYKHHVMPATEENILLSASDIAGSQFLARRNADQNGTSVNCAYSGGWQAGAGTSGVTTVLFNDDSTPPYNDAGAQYATGTGIFTVANTNTYNLGTIINYDVVFTNSLGTATNAQLLSGDVFVTIKKLVGASWVTQALASDYTLTPSSTPTLTSSGHSVSVYWNPVNLIAGEQYRIDVAFNSFAFDLYTAAAVIVTTGTTTAKIVVKTNSSFKADLQSTIITEGYTIELNQSLPTNVKIVDWIMTEFKLGNLYMDIDKTNDNNFIIEDRDNFYSGEVDWTEKRDTGKKREVLPMGELDWKRYDLSYKTDADEYNQIYFNTYKEPFGSGNYEVANEFIKGNNRLEVLYASTPLKGNNVNGLIIPKIYKNDSGVIKNFKALPRNLYYNGLINLPFGSWTLKSSSGDTTYTSNYPFAGDCDNPYNPTLTINWDTPKAVYYNYTLATYTDNNLKNRYYTRFINQITDKNSRIERRWYNLNAYDIETFDFRKVVFDTDAYFIVNAIKDYNVLAEQSTLVELLKLARYDAFTPSVLLGPPQQDITFTERIIGGNYSNGENNTNYGTSSHIVGGSGNFIAAGARNIQLTNCTNVVVSGDVENFIADGLSDYEATESDNNSKIVYASPIIEVPANLSLDKSYHLKILEVDATAGNIILLWDSASMDGCIVYIVRKDASGNTVSISDNDATANYVGGAVPANLSLAQYGTKTLTSKVRTIYNL